MLYALILLLADIPSIPVDFDHETSRLSRAVATYSSAIKISSGQVVEVGSKRTSSDKGGRHLLKQVKKIMIEYCGLFIASSCLQTIWSCECGKRCSCFIQHLNYLPNTFCLDFQNTSSRMSPTTLFLNDLYL